MTVLRLLGSLLLAAALVLIPSSALANGEGYSDNDAAGMVVSDTNPEPCEPFEVIVQGGSDTTEVDLEAEHEGGPLRTWNEDAAAGTAEFTVQLCREGRWVLTAFDQGGEVLGEQAVFVGDGESGGGGGESGGGGDESGGGGGDDDVAGDGAARAGTGDSGAGIGLGDTGVSSSSLLLGGAGLLLLAGGGAALLFSRRRKTQLA